MFVLLAPHLGNFGAGNTAWIDDYKGTPMLFAQRDGTCLALASSASWLRRSAGYVGTSDGWQDLTVHKQMTWTYQRAEDGNVALTGEIDLPGSPDGAFLLVLAFGRTPAEAGLRARACLLSGFEYARAEYERRWKHWQGPPASSRQRPRWTLQDVYSSPSDSRIESLSGWDDRQPVDPMGIQERG